MNNLASVHIHITARGGNQFFQYWTGKYIADTLNRPFSVHFCENLYLNPDIYPNLNIPQQIYIPTSRYIDPDCGYYCYADSDDGIIDVNIQDIIDKHRNTNIPLFLRFNVEDFKFMRNKQDYVKHLYKRNDKYPLLENNKMIIHIRLGDLTENFIALQYIFIKGYIKIIKNHTDLDILLVTENTNHPCIFYIQEELRKIHTRNVDIIQGSPDDWQYHFDVIASAKVIIMSHSTFSWWAAFLNPFNPTVYALITYDNRCFGTIRNRLFTEDHPDGWNVYNMDTEKFINI